MAAKEKADRQQSPEAGVAHPFAIGAIHGAEQCKEREGDTGQNIEPMERNHVAGLPSDRSNISRRDPCMKKAQIAVGIAQTESWSGVSSMP